MSVAPVPYLSIVYTGRNDADSGQLHDRFFRALRFNHDRLAAAGVRYDALFVEWGSVADKPLLADLLRVEVPEINDRLTTIVVDARYHDALSQNPALQVLEVIARNVAIRRASGSYILSSGPGSYLSSETIALFAQRILRPMVLYLASRVELKSHLDTSAIDESVLRDPRNHERTNTVVPSFFTNSAGEFLLLDRFSWHALRGFNEVYRVANLHLTMSFCLRALAAGVLVKGNAARIYQVCFQSPKGASRARSAKPMFYENPANWGLGGAPIFQRSRNDFVIPFDEGVLPPLVSLRGITAQQR
jgi:hypothetical protein